VGTCSVRRASVEVVRCGYRLGMSESAEPVYGSRAQVSALDNWGPLLNCLKGVAVQTSELLASRVRFGLDAHGVCIDHLAPEPAGNAE
jgi:hypothetical protein